MNILDAEVKAGEVLLAGVSVATARGPDGPVRFGVRPEHLTPDDAGPLAVTVQMTEPLGANTLLHGRLDGHPDGFTISLPGVHTVGTRGAPMRFSVQAGQSHVFDPATGVRRF
jgi:sn-glycerol 3-phosphate transport system ATP-binding protein